MMPEKLRTDRASEGEGSWEQDISRLGALELPWVLPFHVALETARRSKKKVLFYNCLGEMAHMAEFGIISLDEEIPVQFDDEGRKLADMEFAPPGRKLPLFLENGVLRGQTALSEDGSPWRLRVGHMAGFPRHGGFSYDLLAPGIFLSPSGRVSVRRFLAYNAGSRAVSIALESDQEWLIAEPSKFRLEAGRSCSMFLRLMLNRLVEDEYQATVRLRYQREVSKARIHVSVRPAPAVPVLQSPETELAVAGIGDSVSIALEFTGGAVVEGAVVDSLHRLRKRFRSAPQNGRETATVTLPTSELIKSVYDSWPLQVFVYRGNEVFEQQFRVRLLRQLIFEPAMPVLTRRRDVSVRVHRHDGAPIRLLVEHSPDELRTRVEGACLTIRAQGQAQGRRSIQWIRLRDEISGERAMLPAML